METIEQILTRQYANFKFRDGQVEYFSLSTQHDKAKTVEEAINNILEADKKYDGKAPLSFMLEKYNTGFILAQEEIKKILDMNDESVYSLLGATYMNEV